MTSTIDNTQAKTMRPVLCRRATLASCVGVSENIIAIVVSSWTDNIPYTLRMKPWRTCCEQADTVAPKAKSSLSCSSTWPKCVIYAVVVVVVAMVVVVGDGRIHGICYECFLTFRSPAIFRIGFNRGVGVAHGFFVQLGPDNEENQNPLIFFLCLCFVFLFR
jgi:hypothetical protein